MIRVDDGLLSRRPGGAVSVQKPGCRGGGWRASGPRSPVVHVWGPESAGASSCGGQRRLLPEEPLVLTWGAQHCCLGGCLVFLAIF